MNLFELFVKIGVDDQASAPLKEITGKLGNGLKTAAKVGTAAVTAAATGITALTTAAVKNYAEYEQLVGGVDTLFKDASKKVQQYASEAYRTSGMSANDYMANATAFSASLISSLGGDTEKAAEYANRAMVSMSDNANKMGTSLDSIVQTYQSLSRGNMAMLDNLKLGYGGTKAELERLIKDAASYTDIQKEMGITVDASSMSFDNIVNAIAVVQGKLGIAGATAAEASTTIEGSVNSMKAAWSNLTVEIAKDNGDIEGSVTTLVESVTTVMDNVMPRVDTAIGGITQLIEAALPKLMELIPGTLANYAPKLINSGTKALGALVTGFKKNAPQLTKAVAGVAKNAISGLVKLAPDAIEVAAELFSGVVAELPDMFAEIVTALPDLLASLGEGIIKSGGAVIGAFGKLFDPKTWLNRDLQKKISNITETFKPLVEKIGEYSADMADFSGSLSASGKTISELDDNIETVEGNITKIIAREFEEQDGYRQKDLENIRKYIQQLNDLQNEKLDVYRSQQTAELRKLSLNTEELSEEELAQYVANAKALLEESNKIAEDMYTQDLVTAENYYKSIGKLDSDEHKKAMEEAKRRNEERLKENEAYYDAAIAGLTGREYGQEEIFGDITSAYNSFVEKSKEISEKLPEKIYNQYLGGYITNYTGTFQKETAYLNALADLDYTKINKWLTATAIGVSSGAKISEEDAKAIISLFDLLKSAPTENSQEYKDLFDVITGGLSDIEGFGDINTEEDIIRAFKIDPRSQGVQSVIDSYGVLGKSMGEQLTSKLFESAPFMSNTLRGRTPVSVVQNIYSQSKSAADLMAEALYQQQKAVLLGG